MQELSPVYSEVLSNEDHHDISPGDETNEVEITTNEAPKKRRSRGPSRLEKLEGKGPFALEWDKAGYPTGRYASSFASYCGKRVRCQVNINFHDWEKDVEDGLKKLLWEDISNKYQVNDKYKEYVLSSCATKWRDFKSKLTKKWIRGKHPKYNSPADCYSYIEQTDWEKFKSSRETNEFKEKSKKAVESVKHNEHPHLMGRRGYNQRVPQWVAESSMSSSSPISSNSLLTDRSWRWIKGMTKSDGKIPNEKTQKVAEQMEEWREKVDSGEFTPNRYDDVLSRSLNKKEHPGRVRGYSGGVSIKDVFGASDRTSQRSVGISDKEVAEITERVRKETIESLGPLIRQETVGLLKRMGLQIPEDLEEHQSSCQSPKHQSSGQSPNIVKTGAGISKETNSNAELGHIKEQTKCRLACLHDGKPFIVAVGTIYPIDDENPVVHGTPLLNGNARVSIDQVLEGTAPLPIPTQYHERVGDAVGSFLQWPKELIILGEESGSLTNHQSIAAKKKQVVSKGSGIKSQSAPKFDDCIPRLGPKCEVLLDLLTLMPSETKTFEVVLPCNVFYLNEDKPIFVTEEDITQLLRMAFLNVSCIQVFMMFLLKLCEERKNHEVASSVGFLCPTIMSQSG